MASVWMRGNEAGKKWVFVKNRKNNLFLYSISLEFSDVSRYH